MKRRDPVAAAQLPMDDKDYYDDTEIDENFKALQVPALFSSRRRSSRRSVRSASSEDVRYTNIKTLFKDFCNRTSSHGVPFLGSPSFFGWRVWMAVCFCAATLFLCQTYWTLSDYFQYRTIIEMQLRFEAAPFPAATVCNLNAFKYSELIQYEDIKEGFDHWEKVINAKEMNEMLREDERILSAADQRWKRSSSPADDNEIKGAVYQPIFVRCSCLNVEQCVPNRNPLEVNASVCMCFEDVTRGLIWPCYPTSEWSVKKCHDCSVISNTCPEPTHNNVSGKTQPCLCQSISHHCMVHPKDEIRWWNPNNYTIFPVTDPPVTVTETEQAFGLLDLKDKGAITTQTKENLIFLVAALPRETRRNLSYTLSEFVLRCSFNSKDCNMERDFKLHIDPEFGNCYTFNFNDSVELKNSRAGPMYGLRLLLDVHQDDYMPTTEAAGVRIVVHEQDQEPFPDTFGYSAPTGFVSSFGLKTKVLHRMDAPYGSCSDTFRPERYIYDEHYSPEGCHRNCFQLKVLDQCGCGDPRFPLPSDEKRYCSAKSVADRQCLSKLISASGGYHHLQLECDCQQPCTENVFETAYSAAAWPSVNFKIGVDCPAVGNIFNDSAACTEYYRVNTAYIEIYYEQLNFETLKETAGYTMVNLFSDFGGNIGLWIGFSVITICEIIELIFEIGYYLLYIKPVRYHKKVKRRNQKEALSLPQLLHRHIYENRPSLRDEANRINHVEEDGYG
uniref:Amiloride-sensitive sodium channel n=2 Tax=Haemonchus contortus TaxID=6289 RepID=A0A7I4YLX0_HAECO